MKLPKIFTTIILSGSFINCHAQFNIPVTTTMHTPGGNVPYTYYVPGPRFNYNYGPTNISLKYRFNIELKNDSSFETRTRINLDKHEDFLLVKVNKEKKHIVPSETKSISRITMEGRKFVGIPVDSCWLFKVRSGKINMYSFLAEENLSYVIAMQEGNDGPIVPLEKETLQGIMWDDPKLLKLIEKKKYVKAIEGYNGKQGM
jgi:hypothetical protein